MGGRNYSAEQLWAKSVKQAAPWAGTAQSEGGHGALCKGFPVDQDGKRSWKKVWGRSGRRGLHSTKGWALRLPAGGGRDPRWPRGDCRDPLDTVTTSFSYRLTVTSYCPTRRPCSTGCSAWSFGKDSGGYRRWDGVLGGEGSQEAFSLGGLWPARPELGTGEGRGFN